MGDPDQPQSAFGEIRQINSMVEEVSTSLKSQRDLLQRRGMNLPPGALQTLAAIESDLARLEERLVSDQTELAQLRTLVEVGAMMNTSLNLDDVLGRAMDEVINLSDAERGFIILYDEDSNAMDVRIFREREDVMGRSGGGGDGKDQLSTTILYDVITTGLPMLTDNAYKDPRMSDGASIANMVLRSVLCVPLKYRDRITGAVYVDNRMRAGVFTEREKILLTSFANQTAVAIENARLFERIQRALLEITEIKDLMASVFSSIGSGVVTASADATILTFNQASQRILELPAEGVSGKSLNQVMKSYNIDLHEMVEGVLERGEIHTTEYPVTPPSGEKKIVSVKLTPLRDDKGQSLGLTMVLDDMTQQREREMALATMEKYLPRGLSKNIDTIANLALGGERREVTCFFVETRPYNTLPPDMRPSDVMKTLNVYLDVASESVIHGKGIIDKYMGNELMVLFNTQLNPMENHALHAVETALYMRDQFLELYRREGINPEPHFYRIGINTGVATLGNVGSQIRKDFTAIGDTINLSKRLEENAARGQIIISEDTLRHLKHGGGVPSHIRVVEHEPIQVKGRQQLTSIYEVFKA